MSDEMVTVRLTCAFRFYEAPDTRIHMSREFILPGRDSAGNQYSYMVLFSEAMKQVPHLRRSYEDFDSIMELVDVKVEIV